MIGGGGCCDRDRYDVSAQREKAIPAKEGINLTSNDRVWAGVGRRLKVMGPNCCAIT